jgi:hypothetical protein
MSFVLTALGLILISTSALLLRLDVDAPYACALAGSIGVCLLLSVVVLMYFKWRKVRQHCSRVALRVLNSYFSLSLAHTNRNRFVY